MHLENLKRVWVRAEKDGEAGVNTMGLVWVLFIQRFNRKLAVLLGTKSEFSYKVAV